MNIHDVTLEGYFARPGSARVLDFGTVGSTGTERLRIVRGPGWEDLTIRAVFHPSRVDLLLPENGELDIPWEATAKPLMRGQGRIVFQGTKDGVVRNSADILYEVSGHSQTEGLAPQERTPGAMEAVLQKMETDRAEIARNAASARTSEAAAASSASSAQQQAAAAQTSAAAAAQSKAAAASSAASAEAAARRAEQYGPQALVNSVNGRTGEVTLSASDIGAAAVSHIHTAAEVGAAPTEHTHTAAEVGAAPAGHSHTASDVGASPAGHTHTAADVSGLPASLPNPNALTLQIGRNDTVVYDGSAEKTLPVAGRVQFAYNGSGSAVYSVFARMRAGSPCTMNFLVADTKAIMASATSTMLVGCTQYTDGTLHMTAHLLDFTSTPYAKFGYYLQDGAFYIGVRRGAYCSATSAVLLSDWGTDCTDFGDFGTVSSEPSGWTAIETQTQPTVTVSTTDITAGSTSLASGAFYVVYE